MSGVGIGSFKCFWLIMQEMNKIEAYTLTKYNPEDTVNYLKKRFSVPSLRTLLIPYDLLYDFISPLT